MRRKAQRRKTWQIPFWLLERRAASAGRANGHQTVVGHKSPAVKVLDFSNWRLCVQRQATAVRMFLHFFRLGILTF